ncbi:hypothetical protein E4U42_006050 [Claviceps africana]|uniref:Subtilisin-like protease n=1 Tax=Claviceps africana TaxID=83212 RepID=A0A8K0NJK6_9HYPO|nr:hypothetical protein E4U42_006050 [Claviceps africana]
MVRPKLLASVIAAAYAAVAVADTTAGRYILELRDGHDHDAVLNHLRGRATTGFKYDSEHFKGLSFKVHDVRSAEQQAREVAALPSVRKVWPVKNHKLTGRRTRIFGNQESKVEFRRDEDLVERAADSFPPHAMTQVDRLHAENVTGAGISVALIGSGIDFSHPALGNGCYGKGCLVSFGYDFVGDAYGDTNKPVPGGVPKDCQGWGTVLAGVLAAQANPLGFTGVAPGITLGAYRIMGCKEGATTDLFLQAMLKASQDKANIIVIGPEEEGGWSESPVAVAASKISDAGIPVVMGAGDSGNAGLFYAGAASSGKKVTAVASFNNMADPLLSYHSSYVINVGRNIDFLYTPGDSSEWGVKAKLYATSLDSNVADDACKPLPDNTPDLSQYIVLVRRGGCDFDDKLKNLASKGAKNILFYNDEERSMITVSPEDPKVVHNTGMVTRATGSAWIKLLKAGRTLTVNVVEPSKAKPSVAEVPNPVNGKSMSISSTWGPTWEMEFKPQFGAPGSSILTTYPVALGSYVTIDGTGASAAFVGGIMALISQVRGTHDPELLNNLLSSTAQPQVWNPGNNYFAELAPAPQQGAGLVQAYDAAHATTLLSPSSLSFNDTDHLATNLNFTLANKGKTTVTYKLDQVAALTMYALDDKTINTTPFPNDAVNSQAVLTFSQNSVTLSPGQTAVVGVTAKPATDVDPKRLAVWSGYVTMKGTDGSSLSIPYQGLTGSLVKAKVLQPDQSWVFPSNNLPSQNFTRSPDKTTFLLPPPKSESFNPDSDPYPSAYINLSLGSRVLRTSLLAVIPGVAPADAKNLGMAFEAEATLNTKGWSTFLFYGKLATGDYAPPGTYQLKTEALKLLGDESKKEDWDIAYTQPFTIVYK